MSRKNPNPVFWLEAVLAALAALLATLTTARSNWIEWILPFELDNDSGALEWELACGLFLVAVLLSAMALRDWRKARQHSG
jgi:membrane protein implicated in regulation of membrane protease activity